MTEFYKKKTSNRTGRSKKANVRTHIVHFFFFVILISVEDIPIFDFWWNIFNWNLFSILLSKCLFFLSKWRQYVSFCIVHYDKFLNFVFVHFSYTTTYFIDAFVSLYDWNEQIITEASFRTLFFYDFYIFVAFTLLAMCNVNMNQKMKNSFDFSIFFYFVSFSTSLVSY